MKTLLQGQTPVLGTWLSMPHAAIIEIVSQSAFDFVLFDGEHAPIPSSCLGSLLPVAERHGASVLYRVPCLQEDHIKTALDAGVPGIMVPMIESVEQAMLAVNAAKYPPLGRRGIGPWRASNFYADFDSYLNTANEHNALVLQIESQAGLDAVDAIAAVDGVDVLYVGPADLASNLGLPIGEASEALLQCCERVAAAALRNGKRAGVDLARPEQLPLFAARGFSLFTYGLDTSSLLQGTSQAYQDIHAAVARSNVPYSP